MLNELLLKSLESEIRDTLVLLHHLVDVVEVAVRLHQVDQGLHGSRLDFDQLRVCVFSVLHVHLVEVFHRPHKVLLPRLEVGRFQRPFLNLLVEDLVDFLFAVEVIDISSI